MKIYLVGVFLPDCSQPEAVKIGVAKDIAKRLESLQTANHLECRLLASWIADSAMRAYAIERKAHRHFKRWRIRGEWFAPKVVMMADFLNRNLDPAFDEASEEYGRQSAASLDRELIERNEFINSLRI